MEAYFLSALFRFFSFCVGIIGCENAVFLLGSISMLKTSCYTGENAILAPTLCGTAKEKVKIWLRDP